tara:strand:+ start:150 stop:572 length:423 start_codon:yes stop_codon:yes gene_type:complete
MKHIQGKKPKSSPKELARKKRYYKENRERILKWKKENPTPLDEVYERRENVKQKMTERLGGVCFHTGCNETKNLEFDHKDPKTKLFNISQGYNRKEEVLIEEVDKCQLFCQKHHLEKTKNDWINGDVYKGIVDDRVDKAI